MDTNESNSNASVWVPRGSSYYSAVGAMLDRNVIPMFRTFLHISNIENDLRTVIEANDNCDLNWFPVWGFHRVYPAGQEVFLKQLAELIFGSDRVINWQVNHTTSHLDTSNVLPPPMINLTTIIWQSDDWEYKFETKVDPDSDNNENIELDWWFGKTNLNVVNIFENNSVNSFNPQIGPTYTMFNTLKRLHKRITMLENNRIQ
jgi:hypothetical protein